MTLRLGLHGFGHVGRCTSAHIHESMRNDVQVAKTNATCLIAANVQLPRFDSIHSRFGHPIVAQDKTVTAEEINQMISHAA